MPESIRLVGTLFVLLAAPLHLVAAEDKFTPEQLEFFESKVRPVLAERCYKCHSAESEEPKGSLRLDSRQAMLDGGDSGAAIVPGDPDSSYLLEVVSYENVDVQMPPKGKLADTEIAALKTWILDGAAWPVEEPKTVAKKKDFNLAERKAGHWCWQPVKAIAPPAVTQKKFVRDPMDAFVLAKLETAGLAPAAPADKSIWLRRITFDLIGLPPTPEEVAAFEQDATATAYETVVDRLLASPHFGERWGRYWLDLVRYAETYGHEFDYPVPEAWRYRDYVVRAINADVPYDQFVTEQIAGDLMPQPRLHPTEGTNESIIGTGFWFLHEQTHAPVDSLQHQADRIDNQVDVMGKTFLGVTLGCARCHDHKFDAISTKDVYSLWGYLQSSRWQLAHLDPKGTIAASAHKMEQLCAEGTTLLNITEPAKAEEAKSAPPAADQVVFETFDGPDYSGWHATGNAFGNAPTKFGQWDSMSRGPNSIPAGLAHSGLLSRKLKGAIRSKSFVIEHDNVWVWAAGKDAKVRVVIDGYMMDQYTGLLFGGLILTLNDDKFNWHGISGDLRRYKGHRAYVEISDYGDGYAAVDEIVFASSGPPKRDTFATSIPMQLPQPAAERLAQIGAEIDKLSAELPASPSVFAICDGDEFNQPVYIRGSHKNPGEPAPRQFLEAIAGTGHPDPNATGSGRLALAAQIVSPTNPLTARVMVNRIWHHLFGKGIVGSTDNFGVLGQEPTHPELLDHLADRFVREGWSVKRLIRDIVLSNTYRMSSVASEKARAADPQNRLLHHMPIRRLEGEAIRDSILAISGRLDRTLAGPSVPVYLTEFMQGRGRPGSGPLDGNGRRSIYQEVRRNFLSPMMLAFDTPIPFNTVGTRSVSNVPAQALTLLNDPFVVEEARRWGMRMIQSEPSVPDARISRMYEIAFARKPTPEESQAAIAFVEEQAKQYGVAGDAVWTDPRVWTDFAHVLFNCKEFIYIQ